MRWKLGIPQKSPGRLSLPVAAGLAAVILALLPVNSHADYRDDIGYTALLAELGPRMPTGRDVTVTQVEPRSSYRPPGPFMPDAGDAELSRKTLRKMTLDAIPGVSSHATSVGRYFYGITSSLAAGIACVEAYESNDFCADGYLHYGTAFQPGCSFDSSKKSSPSRVASHSWVGDSSTPLKDTEILRRLDFAVDADEFIQVVARNNGSSNKPLLGGSYNAIDVGRTDGSHPRGSAALDSQYSAARTKPDLVTPLGLTSLTTPVTASAVALLLESGRDPSLATDPRSTHTVNRDGVPVYNGERSEVVKAALMAGAERLTRNTQSANITDYRVSAENRSPNGLDVRFGAGQLNIDHSYRIITAGEQNSLEDYGPGGGSIGWVGFDYDPSFGGMLSNSRASYYFALDRRDLNHRVLHASLVWNIEIHGGTWKSFNPEATLHNLDLLLFDVTDPQNPQMVAASQSTVDNSENLWVVLEPGRAYMLQVVPGPGQAAFEWDYALAWRMSAPVESDTQSMPDNWQASFGASPSPGDFTFGALTDSPRRWEPPFPVMAVGLGLPPSRMNGNGMMHFMRSCCRPHNSGGDRRG